MPPIEELGREQKALIWFATGTTTRGRLTVANDAEEVEVRWVAKSQLSHNAQGNKVAVAATIETDFEVPIGSAVWQGGFEDITGTGSIGIPEDSFYEVVSCDVTPSIDNKEVKFTSSLMRAGDFLPQRDAST